MVMLQSQGGLGQAYKVQNRLHVGPFEFQLPATDYWIAATDTLELGASTAVGADAAYGFTATSVLFTNTATADFLSSADDTPANYGADALNDTYKTPVIFGNYAHGLYVSKTLGYMPTRLNAEFYAAFTTASAAESATLIGFLTAANAAVAAIYSNGTASTFILTNGSVTDAGANIDTLYHLWRITVDATNTEWFIDGASQGTVATRTDLWPVVFGWFASTTNRPALSWAHIWYE